jgi:hypothetical protein
MMNGFPPFRKEFSKIVQFSHIKCLDTKEHWLQYSGELLLPCASVVLQRLLNCLFTVDQKKRPAIEKVLHVVKEMEQNDTSALDELCDILIHNNFL